MKVLIIGLSVIAVIAIGIQLFFVIYDYRIETHSYQVLDKKGRIEIRQYEPAIFASVTESGEMFEVQNQTFSKLGGYIFGSNESNQTIAMTAPVHMQESSNSSEMRFMMPSEYELSDLPGTSDPSISFEEEPGYYAVAIEFGGYNNRKKYEHFREKLQDFVDENELVVQDDFIVLGYNAPMQWIGRKNEVVIKIERPANKL